MYFRMNVYNVVLCLFMYFSYRIDFVQSVNNSLKHNIFPNIFNIDSLNDKFLNVLNGNHFEKTPKNEQFLTNLDKSQLITLDVNNRRNTDHIEYKYNPSEKSYTYTAKRPYLINKVVQKGDIVWCAKDNRYGESVVITKGVNNEALLSVYFPMNHSLNNIVGVDLLLVDDKQSHGQIRSKRRNSQSVDSLSEIDSDIPKKVTKKEPTVTAPQPTETKLTELPKSQSVPNLLPRKESISEPVLTATEAKPPPKVKLATLDLNIMSSTDQIIYEYNNKEGIHTFSPKTGYEISKIKIGDDSVWESENGVYPEKVLILPGSDNEPTMRMVFPKSQVDTNSKPVFEKSEPIAPPKDEKNQKMPDDIDNESIKIVETETKSNTSPVLPEPFTHKPSVKTPESQPEPEPKKFELLPDVPEKPFKQHHKPEINKQTHESLPQIVKTIETTFKEPQPNKVEIKKSEPVEFPKPEPKTHEPESVKIHKPQTLIDNKPEKIDLNAKNPVNLDINSTSSTNFYDYYKDGDSVIYEIKHGYVFTSVQDMNVSKTIWKAENESEYATKVVRNGATLGSNINKLSIFFKNGQIKHYGKPNDFWKEACIDVVLDINNKNDTYEYTYAQFPETDFFETKYNFRFKIIKEDNSQIWESNDEEHSNVVMLTGRNSKKKVLMVHFLSPNILKFTKNNNEPWTQDKSFNPIPSSLDIKTPNGADHDIYIHFPKQGQLFNLIKKGNEIIWKSRSNKEDAKKVEVYAINKNYLYITIYSLNGNVTKFIKYPNDECREIDSSTTIPITININSNKSSCAYYNYSRRNVKTFRAKDGYIFVGVVEKNSSSNNTSSDKTIWSVASNSENTNNSSNKVEFIKYEPFKEMYEVTIYCIDGTFRKYIKHENMQWTFVNQFHKLPVSVNLNSLYECYKYTISFKNGLKSFTAKLGIVFNSVVAIDADRVIIWQTNKEDEYANKVELDTTGEVKKVIIHLQNEVKKVFINTSDKKWIDEAESKVGGTENIRDDVSPAESETKNEIQQINNPEYTNDIRLYVKDPKDASRTIEMDNKQYEIKQTGNKYEFKLKENSKCTEVKYIIKIRDLFDPSKTIGRKPFTVWKKFFTKTDENYPKSVIYQWPNKIFIHFDTSFIVKEKDSSGSWAGRNFDIDFYTKNSEKNSATSEKMDYTGYELRKMTGGIYEYEFKPSVKCVEITHLFKNKDPHDNKKAIVGISTVWKHGQLGYEEYPTSVSYSSENRIIVDLGTKFITCDKNSNNKWTPRESYLKLYTNPPNSNGSMDEILLLDEKYYRFQKNGDELSYTFNDGAKCTKITFFERIGDPSDISKVTIHNKKVWVYNERIYRGKYPKNVIYEYDKKITMKFDEMVLVYELDRQGNWIQTHLFRKGDNSPTPVLNSVPQAKIATTKTFPVPIRNVNEPLKESITQKPTENTKPSDTTNDNHPSNQNIKEVDPSNYPKEVNIITQGSNKANDLNKFKVYTNSDNDFYLYKFNEGAKCTEIRHIEESADNNTNTSDGKSNKTVRREKVVWSYGSGRYGKQYPQSIFYNKNSSSFIIIFSDHNLICFKKNGSWTVTGSTSTF